MIYFLDTSILVEFLRGKNRTVHGRISGKLPSQLAVPAIVRAELMHGAMKSRQPNAIDNLQLILSLYPTIAFDATCADVSGALRLHLESKGHKIGPNDLLIAATALAHQATLVTHNTSEFSRVPGLVIEDWTQ